MNIGKHSKVIAILRFEDIFQEEPLTIGEYLINISNKQIIKVASHFLGYFNHGSQYNDNVFMFLRTFLSPENFEFRNSIIPSVVKIQLEQPETELVILNVIASLQLIEYATKRDSVIDDQIVNWAEFEVCILKAYLLINQELSTAQTKNLDKLKEMGTKDGIRRYLLVTSLPNFDLINTHLERVFLCQVIKAFWLFSFLEKDRIYNELLDSLFTTYNVCDKREIFQFITTLGSLCLNPKRPEGKIVIEITKDENFEQACHMFNQFCLDSSTSRGDFLSIRENPIYKDSDGIYTIIYSLFLIEKLYKSWYFEFNKINAVLYNPISSATGFRSFYGQHFTEDYLVKHALKGIFREESVQYSGLYLRTTYKNIISEPDYYVRDSRDIFLFETKETFLNADNKVSYDFDLIEKDLISKLYYKEGKKGKIDNKAVKQLIGNIRRILTNRLLFDDLPNSDRLHVYPIILLHDESFNAASINYIVNEWFQIELTLLEKEGHDITNINPVVIITIDTIICFQELFESKRINLSRMLRTYGDRFLSIEGELDISRSFLSFASFADNYIRLRKLKAIPRISLLDQSIRNLMGSIDS